MPGRSQDKSVLAEQETLITQHVEIPPDHGPGDARLVEYGIDIWVLVVYFQHAAERDAATVAQAYQIPIEAVRAALAYYDQHRDVIDAVIAVNLSFAA
jgi:uncharacterized protein (DUF433 family)